MHTTSLRICMKSYGTWIVLLSMSAAHLNFCSPSSLPCLARFISYISFPSLSFKIVFPMAKYPYSKIYWAQLFSVSAPSLYSPRDQGARPHAKPKGAFHIRSSSALCVVRLNTNQWPRIFFSMVVPVAPYHCLNPPVYFAPPIPGQVVLRKTQRFHTLCATRPHVLFQNHPISRVIIRTIVAQRN